jgi:hypothetical protein
MARRILLIALVVVAVASEVRASQLIVNGGFETGNLSGWTPSGDPSAGVTNAFPHSGTFDLSIAARTPYAIVSQTVATVPSTLYTLDYWLQNRDGGFNFFTAQWNGVNVPGSALTDAAPFGYTEFTFHVLATSATSKVTFRGYHQSGNRYLLDDISLTAEAATVPEPSTLMLLGTGLAACFGCSVVRRRRTWE